MLRAGFDAQPAAFAALLRDIDWRSVRGQHLRRTLAPRRCGRRSAIWGTTAGQSDRFRAEPWNRTGPAQRLEPMNSRIRIALLAVSLGLAACSVGGPAATADPAPSQPPTFTPAPPTTDPTSNPPSASAAGGLAGRQFLSTAVTSRWRQLRPGTRHAHPARLRWRPVQRAGRLQHHGRRLLAARRQAHRRRNGHDGDGLPAGADDPGPVARRDPRLCTQR